MGRPGESLGDPAFIEMFIEKFSTSLCHIQNCTNGLRSFTVTTVGLSVEQDLLERLGSLSSAHSQQVRLSLSPEATYYAVREVVT